MVTVSIAFLLGAVAVTAQLSLLREYLTLGGGSEVALGFTLAAWLAAGGLGSLWAGRYKGGGWPAVAASLAALAAAYLLGLWLIWGGRIFLGAAPGEVINWSRALGFAFVAVGPAAFFGGATFALAAAAAREAKTVYIAEAVGSCVAASLFGVFLWRWLLPLTSGAILCGVTALAAGVVAAATPGKGRWFAAALAAAALAAAVGVAFGSGELERRWHFDRAFPGERVVAYRASPYGAVTVTERFGRYAVYENGLLTAFYPDAEGAEETVQPAMLLRPEARRVVLVGGGLGGALEEFAKFPSVREVVYVELDGTLVAAARATYRRDLAAAPPVRFVAADGRAWVRRAAAAGFKADCVIVAMPLPASAQVNRYFTREFYRDVKKALAPGGVFAFAAPGAANYYSPELAAFLSTARATAAAEFPHVAFIPGERFIFLASAAPLDVSPEGYGRSLARTGVPNLYLTPTFFRYALTPDRVAAGARATALAAPLNTDFRPAALYYGLTLWASRAGGAELGVMRAARRLKLWYIIFLAAVAAAPWLIWRRRLGGRAVVAWAVGVQGFVELTLEILIILCFQVVYGTAYLELAIIIGAFMAGLAVGGLVPRPDAARRQTLINILGYTVPIAFALPLLTYGATRLAVPAAVVHVAFAALALAAGLCGGAQFVVALRAWAPRGAGTLYAVDMMGSAAGGVLAAAVFVPVLGIARTALAAAALAAAAIVALAAVPRPASAAGAQEE